MPFERVPAVLAFFMGVTIDADTARRLTEGAGAAQVVVETVAVEHLEAALPPAPVGPAVQQLSIDGAMVPLVGGEWAEVKTLAVGTVVAAQPAESPDPRTEDLSYFSRLADAETFGRLATVETHRRGTETAGVVCAVVDGAAWLQGFVDLHRPDAVRILDFPHAAEHLSLAAQAVFGRGTAAAGAWLSQQYHTLRHGDPGAVLAELQALPTGLAGQPSEAATVVASVGQYLEKRREQIRYADFRAQGFPIGSGCVESANKLVVEARLKGSGMHWARANVNPMLALRAVACSSRWDACWPVLGTHLRRTATVRQQARPALPAAPVKPPRVPTIVNGRPTRDHPWKKYPLLPGSLPSTTRAKP
jgi:hypothetical protein